MDLPDSSYLCQVSRTVSCGACCGLYNVADASYANLRGMLAERTARFLETPRRLDSLLAFQVQTEKQIDTPPPMPDFHHCPFLGLIGRRQTRVGCLLHPAVPGNEGIDFRGLSHYGGLACRTYFCPACDLLAPDVKQIVKTVLTDWYAYGLVITESRWLEALFREVDRRLGRPVRLADVAGRAERIAAFRELLLIKLQWPFRKHPQDGLCHYFFKDGRFGRPVLKLPGSGQTSTRYPILFEELVSFLPDRGQVVAAEAYLDDRLERLSAALAV